jgi:S1-C subfamily serine protease
MLWLYSYIVLGLVLTWVGDTAQAATPEQIFARAAPSVVVVEVMDEKGVPTAQGSGVVIGPGLIITPCHVAQSGHHLRIWHGVTPYAATLGYTDTEHDLCQVYTPQLQAPSVVRGSVKNLAVGQPTYIISAPQGLSLTFTAGIISALRPVLGSVLIQTDAAVSPGSSGGGLFDRAGRLIGMPCFQLQEGQHLNFALPVDWIVNVALRPVRYTEPSPGPTLSDWIQRSITLRTHKNLLAPVKPGSHD